MPGSRVAAVALAAAVLLFVAVGVYLFAVVPSQRCERALELEAEARRIDRAVTNGTWDYSGPDVARARATAEAARERAPEGC